MAKRLIAAATRTVDEVRTGVQGRSEGFTWAGYNLCCRSNYRGINDPNRDIDAEQVYRRGVNVALSTATTNGVFRRQNWQAFCVPSRGPPLAHLVDCLR